MRPTHAPGKQSSQSLVGAKADCVTERDIQSTTVLCDLKQVIQVLVNSWQLSLDTVLAEWSAQLGKEATTLKKILADLRERGVGGGRGR